MPLEAVVEFKRGVYEMALTELARYLPRNDLRTRYLRQGARARDHGDHDLDSGPDMTAGVGFELPPGASFEPDPHTNVQPHAPIEPQPHGLISPTEGHHAN